MPIYYLPRPFNACRQFLAIAPGEQVPLLSDRRPSAERAERPSASDLASLLPAAPELECLRRHGERAEEADGERTDLEHQREGASAAR